MNKPLKILMLHNFYQQKGGEAGVFNDERKLLKAYGHQIISYTKNNKEILQYGAFGKIKLSMNTHWSFQSYKEINTLIEKEKPDIAHFHNTFPLISPSAYYTCQKAGVPVVQTLHNYRLICSSALLLRDSQICELCIGKFFPWPGIIHKCYRDSHVQTGVVSSMLTFHRLIMSWKKQVNAFIVLSEFAKKKVTAGIDIEKKSHIKPNFLEDPGCRKSHQNYAVFIGRLSKEKGIHILMETIQALPSIQLKIIGDGPLLSEIMILQKEKEIHNLEILGKTDHPQVLDLLKNAKYLVLPSIWFEGFPKVLVEAMACGVPSIVSNIGSMKEIIKDNYSGLHFVAGDPYDLKEKMLKLDDEGLIEKMGKNARREYEEKYTPEVNYNRLMEIYQFAASNT